MVYKIFNPLPTGQTDGDGHPVVKDISSYTRLKKGYVIPLASTAYGGSMVPLNRFDNIRLILNFTGLLDETSPRLHPRVIKNSPAMTCAGYTTILYKGGLCLSSYLLSTLNKFPA